MLNPPAAPPRMRVLCTCYPGRGHLHPMLPLAVALAAAGHEVVFSTAAELCTAIERHGFRTIPAGPDHPSSLTETLRRHPQLHALMSTARARPLLVPLHFAGVRLEQTLPTLLPPLTPSHRTSSCTT